MPLFGHASSARCGAASWLVAITVASGCGTAANGPVPATTTSAPPASAASAPAPPAPASPAPLAAESAAPVAPAAPTTSAAPAASASAAAPTAQPSGPPATAKVKVENIGMHIGGGPNDAPTKEPIKKSVEPHFAELAACFARVEEVKKGEFGVDLLVPKDGGRAKVSHPRTALKGKEFERCVLDVFERIEFLKPKGGATMVSYSLRFTPAER